MRYQPSQCLVVNSPVEYPALAAAVKSDWCDGLSAKDHQLPLELDAGTPHSLFSPAAGLKRLVFYYPEAGETWMLKLLKRPSYDRQVAYNFFEKTLVGSNSREWDQWMSRFRANHGETDYRGVLELQMIGVQVSRIPNDCRAPEIEGGGSTSARTLFSRG